MIASIRRVLQLALVLAAFAGPVAAHADPAAVQAQESIRAMYDYGRCVVDYTPSTARRVLGAAPGSAQERSLLRSVADDRCINGHGDTQQLSYGPQMLRGVIAEAILHADVANKSHKSRDSDAQPFSSLSQADIAALSDEGRATLMSLDIAQCLLGTDPAAVKALLTTDPASSDENRAFGELGPQIGPCIPNGVKLTIGKPQLRGALAEAAYRAAFASAHPSK